MSRQFAKPSPCFTIHTHHGNQSRRECPRKQLIVFCQKSLCKSVQNAILSLPKGGPPRDSQTGWFPRNLWPPKCQFRSWKFQFKLKLSHGVIVVETQKLQQQLFHLQSALGLYVLENVFCIPRNLKVLRQFSKPRPCFTIHRHHGNQSRRDSPRTQLLAFFQKILCKSVQKAICSLPKRGPPRDSQTGWFPRNFWPPKCQTRSRKIQLH